MGISVKLDNKSVARVEKSVRESFEKVINNQNLLKDIGTVVIKDIQFQTRKTRKGELKSLSDEWIDERKKIAKATATHPAYSARRSNLTLTGQLLDSLKIIYSKAGEVIIEATGIHRPYKASYLKSWYRIGQSGKRHLVKSSNTGMRTIGESIENKKLAEYVADQGREFMKVREGLNRQLKNLVVAYIRRSSRVLRLFK